jgi:hypothetical protein
MSPDIPTEHKIEMFSSSLRPFFIQEVWFLLDIRLWFSFVFPVPLRIVSGTSLLGLTGLKFTFHFTVLK